MVVLRNGKEDGMKKVSTLTQRAVCGGHYHWKCSVNNFVSTSYSKLSGAAKAAEGHVSRYPSHDTYMTVYSCTSYHK